MCQLNKIICTIIILLVSYEVLLSQKYDAGHNVFNIRDYRQNTALEIEHEKGTSLVISDFGTILSGTYRLPYIYHGQEYLPDLSLLNFRSRMYSPTYHRFLEPDPKSQYDSPYLFVNADPINNTDRDGNEGKPLVLYSLETRSSDAGVKSAAAVDMEKEIDAYYAPISDFVNGDVYGDFSEWNGNVFIESHVGSEGGIAAESYRGNESISLDDENISKVVRDGVQRDVYVDVNKFGERLSGFSLRNNTPINTITVGGCEGANAAEKLGEATTRSGKLMGLRNNITTHGFKPNRYSVFMGRSTFNDATHRPFPYCFYPIMEGPPDQINFYLNRGGPVPMDQMHTSGNHPWVENVSTREESPIIRGRQFNEFVNGRIPSGLRSDVTSFSFPRVPY